MGYWFLIYCIGTAWLMFSVTPQSSRRWRMGRTVIAFIVGYGITMVLLYIHYIMYPLEYSRIGAHWFMMGWLWTLTYIGWCELAWRIRHRKALISIRKGLGDDWINGKVLFISSFGILLFLLIFVIPMIIMELQRHGVIAS